MRFMQKCYLPRIGVFFIIIITAQVRGNDPESPTWEISAEASQVQRQTKQAGDQTCGRRATIDGESRKERSGDIVPAIVGGTEAENGDWPWMVDILKKDYDDEANFYCGGSLIHVKYVLTCAHCYINKTGEKPKPYIYVLSVGSVTIDGGKRYNVRAMTVHPEFNPPAYENDITIIEVKGVVILGKYVGIICLYCHFKKEDLDKAGTDVTVIGHGAVAEGADGSPTLLQVEVKIISRDACGDDYQNETDTFPNGVTDEFICAGVKEGGKDSCQGDSGGPLMTMVENKQWYQVGIVSNGVGCARPEYPGVYASVLYLRPFIMKHTKGLVCQTRVQD